MLGISTIVNCQNVDGKVRVYSRQNAKEINAILISRIRDIICDFENLSQKEIGDFGEESFLEMSRKYIRKIENEYDQSKENLINSIGSLCTKLGDLIGNTSCTNESDEKKQEMMKMINLIRKKIKINQKKKMIINQKMINQKKQMMINQKKQMIIKQKMINQKKKKMILNHKINLMIKQINQKRKMIMRIANKIINSHKKNLTSILNINLNQNQKKINLIAKHR